MINELKKTKIKAITLLLILSFLMIAPLTACSRSDDDYDGEDTADYEETKKGDYTLAPGREGPCIIVIDNKAEKYGAMDATGTLVIPCDYDEIIYAGNDRFIVTKGETMGVLDKDGREVVPCEYDSIDNGIRDPDYLNANVGVALVQKDSWGLLSMESGELLTDLEYEDAMHFMDGLLAPVYKDGKYGYIDKTGKLVIPPAYIFAENFENGGAKVAAADKGGAEGEAVSSWGVIDEKGNIVIPCEYESVQEYKDGLAIASKSTKKDEEEAPIGVVGKDGKEVIPFTNNITMEFVGPFISCTDSTSDKTEYYDRTGKKINGYSDMFAENDDEPIVVRDAKSGKFGLINKDSGVILETKYDAIGQFKKAGGSDKTLATAMLDGKVGVIDSEGHEITEFKYLSGDAVTEVPELDATDVNPMEGLPFISTNGLIPVKKEKDGKTGLLNTEGKEVTDFKYTEVRDCRRSGTHRLYEYVAAKTEEGVEVALKSDGTEIAGSEACYEIGFDYACGPIAVRSEKGGLWALMDANGKLITDYIFNTEEEADTYD